MLERGVEKMLEQTGEDLLCHTASPIVNNTQSYGSQCCNKIMVCFHFGMSYLVGLGCMLHRHCICDFKIES